MYSLVIFFTNGINQVKKETQVPCSVTLSQGDPYPGLNHLL